MTGVREAAERVQAWLGAVAQIEEVSGPLRIANAGLNGVDLLTEDVRALLSAAAAQDGTRNDGDDDATAFLNCGPACRDAKHHTQEPGCFYVGAELEPCESPCPVCHPEPSRPNGWYDEREERRLARRHPDMPYARCPSAEPHPAHYWSPFAQPTCRCIGIAASEGGEGRG